MREYALSQKVRAGGGTLKSEEDALQVRVTTGGQEKQVSIDTDVHAHPLPLFEWRLDQFVCKKCKETRKRPQSANEESFGYWGCTECDDFKVCLTCGPVALKAKLAEQSDKIIQ
jgi:hypothetical protein